MAKPTKAHQKLLDENKNLRSRLGEAEETLHAIRSGEVDAFVVGKAENIQTIPLKGADYPYRAMVESMNEGALTLIPDGTIFFCNPRFAEMIQTPSEKLIGSPFQNLIPPDEQGALATLLKASRQASARGDFHLQTTTATRVPVQLSVRQLKTEDMKGISIVVIDLTERKHAEEALRESEEHFRALVENASDLIAVLNLDGTLRYASPAVERMLGYTVAEATGKSIYEFVHPEDVQNAMQAVAYRLENADVPARLVEIRARHADGTWRILEGRGENLLTHQGVTGIVLNFHDITERKQAEETLRESEEKYRTLLDEVSEGFYISDLNGVLTFVNGALARILGLAHPEELTGRRFLEFVPPE